MAELWSIENGAEHISRRLASRFSRRSFLGGIGKGSVALAAASAGIAIDADVAGAATYCGGNTSSITCATLTGSNSCPPNTCGCGYWLVCAQQECTYGKIWSDCCAQYTCNCSRPSGFPSCCFTKEWRQGCGTLNQSKVKCRRWYCSSGC